MNFKYGTKSEMKIFLILCGWKVYHTDAWHHPDFKFIHNTHRAYLLATKQISESELWQKVWREK
jgi:hypothetical protein